MWKSYKLFETVLLASRVYSVYTYKYIYTYICLGIRDDTIYACRYINYIYFLGLNFKRIILNRIINTGGNIIIYYSYVYKIWISNTYVKPILRLYLMPTYHRRPKSNCRILLLERVLKFHRASTDPLYIYIYIMYLDIYNTICT